MHIPEIYVQTLLPFFLTKCTFFLSICRHSTTYTCHAQKPSLSVFLVVSHNRSQDPRFLIHGLHDMRVWKTLSGEWGRWQQQFLTVAAWNFPQELLDKSLRVPKGQSGVDTNRIQHNHASNYSADSRNEVESIGLGWKKG